MVSSWIFRNRRIWKALWLIDWNIFYGKWQEKQRKIWGKKWKLRWNEKKTRNLIKLRSCWLNYAVYSRVIRSPCFFTLRSLFFLSSRFYRRGMEKWKSVKLSRIVESRDNSEFWFSFKLYLICILILSHLSTFSLLENLLKVSLIPYWKLSSLLFLRGSCM